MFCISTILLAIVTSALIYFYFKHRYLKNYWKHAGVKFVPPKIFFGNMAPLIFRKNNFLDFVRSFYDRFSNERYYGIFQFNLPFLVVKDPNLIKTITVKEFDSFSDHMDFINEELDPIWAKSLIVSKGNRWRSLRNSLTPSFTGSKMRILFGLIKECSQQLTEFFKAKNEEIVEVEMKELFARYTNDVIATCAFGIKCDSIREPKNEFYLNGRKATDFSGLRSLQFFLQTSFPKVTKFFKLRLFPQRIVDFFSNIIEETVRLREEKHIIRPDMIHLLMEVKKQERKEYNDNPDAKPELTIEDIVSQAFIFFIAGFETISSGLSFAAYELAINPDVQKKLLDEVDETNKRCNGDITYDELNRMKYMDMVISETLRKWPLSVITDRQATKPFTIEPENPDELPIHLKKGDVVSIPIVGLHYDPKYYPNPDKFDPERFSEENKAGIHPFAYLPFGAGPRNCIGSRFALLEMKLLLFHIFSDFEIVPTSKSQIPLVLSKSFNMTAENGFHFGFKRRNVV